SGSPPDPGTPPRCRAHSRETLSRSPSPRSGEVRARRRPRPCTSESRVSRPACDVLLLLSCGPETGVTRTHTTSPREGSARSNADGNKGSGSRLAPRAWPRRHSSGSRGMLPTGEPVLVTRGDAQIDIIVHNVALVSLGRNGEPVGISTRHGLRAALGLLVL